MVDALRDPTEGLAVTAGGVVGIGQDFIGGGADGSRGGVALLDAGCVDAAKLARASAGAVGGAVLVDEAGVVAVAGGGGRDVAGGCGLRVGAGGRGACDAAVVGAVGEADDGVTASAAACGSRGVADSVGFGINAGRDAVDGFADAR